MVRGHRHDPVWVVFPFQRSHPPLVSVSLQLHRQPKRTYRRPPPTHPCFAGGYHCDDSAPPLFPPLSSFAVNLANLLDCLGLYGIAAPATAAQGLSLSFQPSLRGPVPSIRPCQHRRPPLRFRKVVPRKRPPTQLWLCNSKRCPTYRSGWLFKGPLPFPHSHLIITFFLPQV